MKLGFSSCNQPQRDFYGNMRYSKERGYECIEAFGPQIDAILAEGRGDELAALSAETVPFTVHHITPPTDPEKKEDFRQRMRRIHEFHLKHPHCILVLSFDTWAQRDLIKDSILYVLDLFSDTSLPIATEDYPLNAKDAEDYKECLAYPNYCLLSDLGHTNVRLSDTGEQKTWCLWNEGENLPLPAGVNTPEAFANAMKRKPLPVVQVHVHNNDGTKDNHRALDDGTADFAGVAKELRKLGWDGIVILEASPTIHGITGDAADRFLEKDTALWRSYWNA